MTQPQRDPRFILLDELSRCAPWLQAALDHAGGTTHTLGDLYNGIMAGNLHLWPAEDAVLITEFVQYPREVHIHGFLAGGNLETVDKLRHAAEEYGRQMGCAAASVSGRLGWTRHLKKEGYETTLHTVVKRLDSDTMPETGEEKHQ